MTESDFGWEHLYTGRRLDAETGLYNYRARYYHAQLGRFPARDPIGYDGGDMNLYAYVGGNPVLYSDATGLCPCNSDETEHTLKAWVFSKIVDVELAKNVERKEVDKDEDPQHKLVRKSKTVEQGTQVDVVLRKTLYELICCEKDDKTRAASKDELKTKTVFASFGSPSPGVLRRKMNAFAKYVFPVPVWDYSPRTGTWQYKCLVSAGPEKVGKRKVDKDELKRINNGE